MSNKLTAFDTEVEMGKKIDLGIDGLHWFTRWRMNNGQEDSFVVPFPTCNPINIIGHDGDNFDYGQFGIHLGQVDRLTFLGDFKQEISAIFVDLREGSPTERQKVELKFFPSTRKTLVIPPGVAHTFNGLKGVKTINDYEILLPQDGQETSWNLGNDIINLPLDTEISEMPLCSPNSVPATFEFYANLSAIQNENIPKIKHYFPETRNIIIAGQNRTVLIKERIQGSDFQCKETKVGTIDGVYSKKHLKVRTSRDSYISPLTRNTPFYLVEHGIKEYKHDSYGVHLGQEDRLTFLTNGKKEIELTLVDMRKGSKTLHTKETVTIVVSQEDELVIPQGVAHAFKGLNGIYTLNRPILYLDSEKNYRPGYDVVDWPINNFDFPEYEVNELEATQEFYLLCASKQNELMTKKSEYCAPRTHVYKDAITGKDVRIVLRKKAEVQAVEID